MLLNKTFCCPFKQTNKQKEWGSRILSKSVFLVLTFVLYFARDCDCISNLDFYGLPALIYNSIYNLCRPSKQTNKQKGWRSRILSKSVFLVLTFVLYFARDCDCISNLDFYGLPALIYKSGCSSSWLKITIVDVGRRIEVCQA